MHRRVKLTFDGALRQAERTRDFGQLQPLMMSHDEHETLSGRKPCDLFFERLSNLSPVRLFFRARALFGRVHHPQLGIVGEGGPTGGCLPAAMIDTCIHDYSVQPRRELRVVAKTVEGSIDLDEDVLGNVFGVVMIAGELVRHPIHHRAMALDERAKCGRIAAGRAGNEVRICRRAEAAVHCQRYDDHWSLPVDRQLGPAPAEARHRACLAVARSAKAGSHIAPNFVQTPNVIHLKGAEMKHRAVCGSFCTIVLVAMACGVSPADAQSLSRPGTWTVTPFLQTSAGVSGTDTDNSIGLGVAASYDLTSNLGFEGELGHLFDVLGNDANVDWSVTNVSANAVYHFDVAHVTPYATFGLGFERSSISVKNPDSLALVIPSSTEVAYNFGGGIKYRINDSLIVRADLRRFQAIDMAPDYWRLYGGLMFSLKR